MTKAIVRTIAECWYMEEHKCSLAEAKRALAAQEKRRLNEAFERAKSVPAVNWFGRN
jgi:hypothetical protein